MAETKAAKKSLGKKAKTFFVETKSELSKATWPSWSQLVHNTGVILVFIAVVAVILSVLDIGFSKLFQFITEWL
ncbi:MAG: preprotein translocase subunit SecE [Clostridia bacterium]|nr:preprotein translocase subunit SecE [Clostridia bacterium]